MTKKDMADLVDVVREMFAAGPEATSIEELRRCYEEGGIEDGECIPTYDEMREACEILVRQGDLQRAGRQGYEATIEFGLSREFSLDELHR